MNWKLVSDGLILISFKSIGVFSVAELGLWESRSLSVPSVGFGPGPWWAVTTWPAVPASTPGNSNICRTSLAVMQMLCKRDCSKHPTAPRWELAQRVTGGQAAGEELKPKDHLSLEPADKAICNKQPKLCITYWDWGTEITQIGRVFWRCVRIYTSASVNLLKEVKVLPRKFKANCA